ncbi:MAG: hypothetical protein L0220_31395 [Acidobacteria bacterium]|nr:hypothetical protein [Acidobacteriota bacterium]
MKFTLVCVVLIGSVLFVVGQERGREDKGVAQTNDAKTSNDQIEVKTDRFSNVITVTLKPQVILDKPDHYLTMEIKTKLGEKKFSDWEREMVNAFVNFESQSKVPVDFGDRQLHFMIDGKPLNLAKTSFSVSPHADRYGKLKPGFKISESFTSLFDRRALEQFSKANRIEMRLGSFEPTLSQSVVMNLREYANQVLAQHKIVMERKP